MAVQKIKMASIIGRMNELDEVTVRCGQSEVFHPDNVLSFYSDTASFIPISEDNPYSAPLQRLVESCEKIQKQLMFQGNPCCTADDSMDRGLFEYVTRFCTVVEDSLARQEELKRKLEELTAAIQDISHFKGLDLKLEQIHNRSFIKVRFGCMAKESFDKLSLYNDNPYVTFFPSAHDDSLYWGVYFAPIDQVEEVDRIFSSLYFKRIDIGKYSGTAEETLNELEENKLNVTGQLKELQTKLDEYWEQEKEACQQTFNSLKEKSIYFGIRHYGARYHDSFVLTGWIPETKESEFKESLEPLETVEYTFEKAEAQLDHSPPVHLKNPKPFRPFEFFVEMFGLPSYNEVDPTIFVGITYVMLFGIMFGDVGQGLVVSLVGLFMWNKLRMKLGKILIPCGISSACFGLIYGSVFGFEHALDPLYRSLFGLHEKPVEVMEPATTNLIIYLAIAIGLSLVMVAMLINIYSSVKKKQYGNALFGPNGLAGLVFYGSLVFGFGGKMVMGWQLVTPFYVVCFMIVPLILMFFREILSEIMEGKKHWKPESWGDFIMQNFFEVFEFLLSYATNTMSFLRVGAFVLVHAGMMMVVFTLAEMSAGIGYALIVIFGNIFVMVLEALLVGIQVLRLEYYEMFSRFFDGTGRPFHPVSARQELTKS
ncbi:V-type ATP synthase subunit I [Clostridium minihomine]|uniref:V-type ATP synthase subunit I n=1 Tax=Clostridium minihomine TaxID=2045012 RepID=UPI001FB451EF|nr:V-type ATPase 116kDa subunit family protein [Clostridium minihomine]